MIVIHTMLKINNTNIEVHNEYGCQRIFCDELNGWI